LTKPGRNYHQAYKSF